MDTRHRSPYGHTSGGSPLPRGHVLHRTGLPIGHDQNGPLATSGPFCVFGSVTLVAMRTFVLAALIGLGLTAACSIGDTTDGARTVAPSTTNSTTTTTTGEDRGRSTAFVEVGGAAYDLDAQCYAAGAGEVVITALTSALVEPRVELYVQAFLAEPYVGISVTADGETSVYEPSLAVPFEILEQDDVYRFDGVDLVIDLDLETGTGSPAGTGTVVVECAAYAEGLPPGFGSG